MKKIVSLVVFISMAGLARAGDMETAAASANLTNFDMAAARNTMVTAPSIKKPVLSQNWIAAGNVWLDTVKANYAEKGIDGFKDPVLIPETGYGGLPISIISVLVDYRKECLDMKIGTPIKTLIYKFTVDGKDGFIVQCEFDEYTFSSVFDASGTLLADGSADSSEFGWNN